MTAGLAMQVPAKGYTPPATLPRRGRIEVVRFIRSDQRLDLFGKKITLAAHHAYTYVTAIIRPRGQTLTVINIDGEIIHESKFPVATQLR